MEYGTTVKLGELEYILFWTCVAVALNWFGPTCKYRPHICGITCRHLLLTSFCQHDNHRLNGSSSPVLTATCLSYGRLCDFLGFFFPEPTWRSHPSTDFDAKWLKRRGFMQGRAFWSKNRNFLKPLSPKPPKFAQFWSGLRKFSLDFAFNIGGLTSKHPLIFIGAK